jgi:hypothetical protein
MQDRDVGRLPGAEPDFAAAQHVPFLSGRRVINLVSGAHQRIRWAPAHAPRGLIHRRPPVRCPGPGRRG